MMKRIMPFFIAAIPGLFDRGLALSDYHSPTATAVCWGLTAVILLAAVPHAIRGWNGKNGEPSLQTWHFVLFGLAGAWIFVTILFASVAVAVWRNPVVLGGLSSQVADGRPLQWYYNLTMNGGPLSSANVYSLQFTGSNVSQREVRLKSASIRSAITGTEIALVVIAENDLVPIDTINLVPPGAPILLLAQFSPPSGVTSKEFLSQWSQFNLVVTDDSSEYRLPFNEGSIQAFFPGMIGPHITRKAQHF